MNDPVACPSEYNGSISAKNWFAVFTVPRHEKRVGSHFDLRGIESFLPIYRKRREWKDGSKGIVELPLFSSYIFVRIESRERLAVLTAPGVISIIGAGNCSLPVPDSYIGCLREATLSGKIEPYPFTDLAIGTAVRIRSGLMAGMEGILLRQKNNLRVVLTQGMIMRSATLEVDIDDIEPVVHPKIDIAPGFVQTQKFRDYQSAPVA